MDDLLINTPSNDDILNQELLDYGKNLSEFDELRKLEEQFTKKSTDISLTKSKLTFIEQEIKATQEREKLKQQKIEEYFRLAREFEEKGNLESALESYLGVLEQEKKNPRAIFHIQKIKKEINRKEREIQEKEKEAKLKAQKALEHFESGKRFYREGNFEKALDEFNSAIFFGGRSSEILEYKENCELRINEVEEAINRAKKENEAKKRQISELSIGANNHFRKNEYEAGIELLEKALLIMPDNKDIGESLRQAEIKFKEYKSQLKKIEDEKNDKLKKVREAQLKVSHYKSKHDFENALIGLQDILILDPSNDDFLKEAHELQNIIRVQKEEHDSKKERTIKEKTDKENFLKENYGKGIGFFAVNDFEKAILCFSNVITLDPHYEEVEAYMHKIEEKIFLKSQKEHELELKRIEALDKQKKIELEEQRRVAEYEEKKKLHEQEEAKKRFAEINENFEVGLRLFSDGKYEAALLKFEKCIAKDPTNEIYGAELEKTRKKISDIKELMEIESRKQAEEKEKLQKFHAKLTSLNEQAERFFQTEMYLEAIEIWEQILREDFSNARAKEGILGSHLRIKTREEQRKLKEEKEKEDKINSGINSLNEQAERLFKSEMYLEAIEVWGKILSEDSVHARAKEGMLESHLRIKTREEQKKLKEEKEKEDKIKSKINSLNEQAERLFTSEMYSEAIEVWGKILFEDSANTRAKEGILESHLRIKTREEQKKIREEKEIEEKIRSKINSLNEQAERFFQSEMFKEAIEVWRKVLVEDSADSKAKEGILEASSRIKILEEQKIIKGQKEIEDRIRSRVDSLNEQAERFFQNGMYKEAIDVWGKVLNEEMTNPKAKEGILECHLRLQNIEKERLLKEENIRSEKEKCEQLSFKAQVLYNEDNFLEAIKLWEEVLVSSPLHNDARRGIMQAKTRYRELELCRDVKFRLEKSFSEIEKRFNEFKKQFSEGNKYFLAGDYRRALDIWNSIENT